MNLDLLSMQSSIDSSAALTESLFLQALGCRNKSNRTPVWVMRQAGRYLPEYQKLKKKYSLDEMFHTPELIRQITILPVDLLGVDAAILFADILHVIKMLGASAHFKPEGGISVTPILCGPQDLQKLHRKSPLEALFFVEEGIILLKKELQVPLIGFCGGPFTGGR